MEALIRDLRNLVRRDAADLEPAFDMYADEAHFGRSLIDTNLTQLGAGAQILEIGAGMLLLSSQLQREGFTVTALEPVGEGFNHFQRLHKIVFDYATENGFAPLHLTSSAEQLDLTGIFDFAFSMNVMEHVCNFPLVLQRVYAALRPGAVYRFVCPNYAFPYEPHYNIPTLFSKQLTEKLMRRWIMRSPKALDPVGTWNSLNWISVAKVRRTCRTLLAVEPSFDSRIFDAYLERALTNPFFQSRHGPLIFALLRQLRALGLLRLTRFIPVACLPAMDCTVHRHALMSKSPR